MKKTAESKNRYPSIDALRALAAIGIIMMHIGLGILTLNQMILPGSYIRYRDLINPLVLKVRKDLRVKQVPLALDRCFPEPDSHVFEIYLRELAKGYIQL